jgi:hypothetical protein
MVGVVSSPKHHYDRDSKVGLEDQLVQRELIVHHPMLTTLLGPPLHLSRVVM